MAAFDLSSGYFQKGRDGRTLFYPWGALGRGYVVASQRDEDRLRRDLKVYLGGMLALLLGAGMLKQYVAGAVIAAVGLIFYYTWVRYYLTRGLKPADETMRLREAMIAQAMGYSWAILWSLELISLVLAGMGIFVLVIEPAEWLMAGACIAIFAPVAAFFAWMMALRREGTVMHQR